MLLLVDGRLSTSFDESRAQFVQTSVIALVKLLEEPRLKVDCITATAFHPDNRLEDVFGEVVCVRSSADHSTAHLLLRSGTALIIDGDEVRGGQGISSGLPVVWQGSNRLVSSSPATKSESLAMCA